MPLRRSDILILKYVLQVTNRDSGCHSREPPEVHMCVLSIRLSRVRLRHAMAIFLSCVDP